ncbi:MAG: hypothetical protein AAFR17_10335 [Pseudomonadota bacterium]
MTDITGTNGANVLFGGLNDDLIRGKGGDDQIFGNAGNDRLKGGNGEDEITDGAGVDRMWGGNGADTFKLSADGEFDRIQDWEFQDLIDLSDWGVTDLSDLTFTELSNGQVRITAGDEVLQIKGKGGASLTAADFTADKFVFAEPPQLIDFESLSIAGPQFGAPIQAIDPGYEGLTWTSPLYFIEEPDMQALGRAAGAENRTGGGDVYASNAGGYDVHFQAADNFDFEEVTLGAMYNDGLTVRIIGMDDGVMVGEQSVVVDTTASSTVQLDDQIFDSVDQVVFQSFGGTLNQDYAFMAAAPDSSHFYMDDLVLA